MQSRDLWSIWVYGLPGPQLPPGVVDAAWPNSEPEGSWQILLLPEPVYSVDRLQCVWPWLGAHPTQGPPPATVRSPLQVGDMEITSHHDCKLPVAAFITRWRNAFFFGNQSLTSRARNLTQMVKQPSFSPNPSNVCVYLDTPFYRIPTIILGRPFSEILELHSRLSLHLACPSEVYIHSFIP